MKITPLVTPILICLGLIFAGPSTLIAAEHIREANLNCEDYYYSNHWRDEDCEKYPYWDTTTLRVVKSEKDYPYEEYIKETGFVVWTGPNTRIPSEEWK